MTRRTAIEEQTSQIASNRVQASQVIARRRTRARRLPRVAVGLSVLTGIGVATAWVEQQLPAVASTQKPAAVDPGAAARDAAAQATAAQLAAYETTLAALTKTLQADNAAIASLGGATGSAGTSSAGRSGTSKSVGGGGSSSSSGGTRSASIPGLPKLPTISIPKPPPVQAVTGASGAVK